jgi:hypothetical protein
VRLVIKKVQEETAQVLLLKIVRHINMQNQNGRGKLDARDE